MIPEQTAELVRLRLEQAQSTLNDAVVLAEGGGTPKSIPMKMVSVPDNPRDGIRGLGPAQVGVAAPETVSRVEARRQVSRRLT